MELLGGVGLDPSKMMPLADLCYPFRGPGKTSDPRRGAQAPTCLLGNLSLCFPPVTAQMKIGCDSAVVRMVSSGRHTNRMTVEYHQLETQDMEAPNENGLQPACVSGP